LLPCKKFNATAANIPVHPPCRKRTLYSFGISLKLIKHVKLQIEYFTWHVYHTVLRKFV